MRINEIDTPLHATDPTRDISTCQEAALEDPDVVEVETQAQVPGGKERYFLYAHEADPSDLVEVQWEDSHSAAVESFLLPELLAEQPYPVRAKYVGPNEWDLVDPQSDVPPILVAITAPEDNPMWSWIGKGPRPTGGRAWQFKRYLVGVADWPEAQEYTHQELWGSLDEGERATILGMWRSLCYHGCRPYAGQEIR